MNGKQVDGKVRSESVTYIGKEEVQPVKRAMRGGLPRVFQGRALERATQPSLAWARGVDGGRVVMLGCLWQRLCFAIIGSRGGFELSWG